MRKMNTRAHGRSYEHQVMQYMESIGFQRLAQNCFVEGGEIDLVFQCVDSRFHRDQVEEGEICFIEVKGRQARSEWNSEVVSLRKQERWSKAALQVIWMLEEGDFVLPLPITGYQMVLVVIEDGEIEVRWNAFDLILG